MSPRTQRLATDWKTYVALIGAVSAAITAFTGLFNQLKDSFQALHDLPAQAKWVAVTILAVIALVTAIAAWSRRSILLRPDRFIVSADDPEQLKGRSIEVETLAKECEANPLVFLEGESGTGKSALVRAGLAAFLVDPAEKRQLIPVLLDASSLSWKEGLRIQLSRAVAGLSPADRVQLGAPEQFGTDDVFKEIGSLPRHVPRRLLLILDQVDDYVVAHRNYMLRANKVLTSDELVQENPNWGALADLVNNGRLHLLLVCRNDIFSRLDSFRFAKVATFTLWRIDQQLISPLLDQVTQDDGNGPVVENSEYGWLQLKLRLLRDLSSGTHHILPIQLAIALDSLRRFRTLTLGEYARNEGARGLERLHIERHLAEIARSRRIDERALLRGLMLLVTEGGQKTQRATRQAFCDEVLSGTPPDADLLPVIEHLVRWRILRYQLSDDGEYLLLHHDFLARGVWETYRQANRWTELLKQRTREFKDALSWLQRWRALLPPTTQVRLLWARVRERGRFRFGEHAPFAVWSLFRFVPVFAFAACVWLGYLWVDIMRQEQFAEGIFASVASDPSIDENEARDWASLAAAKEDARIRAVRRGLAKPAVAAKLSRKTPILVHAVVGLDPTGQHSHRFALEVVLPTIREHRIQSRDLSIAVECPHLLRIGSAETNTLAIAAIQRMKIEKDREALNLLARALKSFSEKLNAKDIQPLAAVVVERMKTEKDSEALSSLSDALTSLSGKLGAKDVQPIAVALVELMKAEKNSEALSSLGKALGSLSGKLDQKDVQPAAAALVERMKTEKGGQALFSLSDALGSLNGKLEANDVRPAVVALVEQMKTEKDSNDRSWLGKALDTISGKLGTKDIEPLTTAVVEQMKTENNSDVFLSLDKALRSLSGKLNKGDVQLLAAAVIERMKTEKNNWWLSQLCEVLGYLSEKLDAKDVQPAVVALIEQMKNKEGGHSLLGEALGSLSGKLDVKDIQPVVVILIEQVTTEQDDEELDSLGKILVSFSGKLDAKDVQPLAAALLVRMKTETRGALFSLGAILCSLSGKLDAKDVQPLAAVLVERMRTEKDNWDLFSLGKTLGGLSGSIDAKDVRIAAAALVEGMKTEKDSQIRSRVLQALRSLSGKLDAKTIRPVATALVEQMKAEKDSEALTSLSEALGSLCEKLNAEDVQPLATVMIERMKTEKDSETLSSLGGVLGRFSISEKLDPKHVQPAVAALIEQIRTEKRSWRLSSLIEVLGSFGATLRREDAKIALGFLSKRWQEDHGRDAVTKGWILLEAVANRDMDLDKRIQKYVDLLALPLILEENREALLSGLESHSDTKFGGDIWRFVEWATATDRGKSMHLNLDQRGH